MSTQAHQQRRAEIAAINTLIFLEPVLARERCLNVLADARLAFDNEAFIQAALQLSRIEDQLGDLPTAINVLSEAFAYAQEFRLFHLMPGILEQLGCCHYSLAHYAQALEAWQQCILLCGQQAQLVQTRAMAFIGIGRICDLANQHQRAVNMHQRAHELLLPSQDAYLITMAKINWAVNLSQLKSYTLAQQVLQAALEMSLAHDLPHHVAECEFRLAQIAIAQGDLSQAELRIEEGLAVVARTPYHWVEINLLVEWAGLLGAQGTPQQALDVLQRGLQIAQEDGFRHLELQILRKAQQYSQLIGQKLLAADYARQADFLHMQLSNHRWTADGLNLAALDELLQ